MPRELSEEAVEAGARAAFWRDDLGGHIAGRWTWDSIPDEGRENYRRMMRDALRAAIEALDTARAEPSPEPPQGAINEAIATLDQVDRPDLGTAVKELWGRAWSAESSPEEDDAVCRCDTCGCGYTNEALIGGPCGELQPPCNGTIAALVPSPEGEPSTEALIAFAKAHEAAPLEPWDEDKPYWHLDNQRDTLAGLRAAYAIDLPASSTERAEETRQGVGRMREVTAEVGELNDRIHSRGSEDRSP